MQEDLGRKLLEQELEAAKLAKRADEAEQSALEMKSQLYAGIGIMAGSYAHNIKNLLVRPNDLLARCLEADGREPRAAGDARTRSRSTLGTVTERLQQILRTVRRDPSRAEMTRVDLAELVAGHGRTWADMGRDKWKLRVDGRDVPGGPLRVDGDLSHLQQAVENLVFNARDATFEMRNHLREEARRDRRPTRPPAGSGCSRPPGGRGRSRVAARRDGRRGRAGGAGQRHRDDARRCARTA